TWSAPPSTVPFTTASCGAARAGPAQVRNRAPSATSPTTRKAALPATTRRRNDFLGPASRAGGVLGPASRAGLRSIVIRPPAGAGTCGTGRPERSRPPRWLHLGTRPLGTRPLGTLGLGAGDAGAPCRLDHVPRQLLERHPLAVGPPLERTQHDGRERDPDVLGKGARQPVTPGLTRRVRSARTARRTNP